MASDTAVLKALAAKLDVDVDTLRASVTQDVADEAPAKRTRKAAAPKPAPKPLSETLKDDLNAKGYDFTTGRTYVSAASIEAQARLATAKKPGFEIVASEKSGTRTAAVVVVRDETGKVYVQNLRTL